MTTVAIRNEQDRQRAITAIQNRAMPITVNITKGLPRTDKQNHLQQKWHGEAAEQGDMTAEEYRGYCKLHFGVAIMKSESPEWAEKYDRLIRPLPYEQKLEMMMVPIDFPVTRGMSTKGKTKYLDQVHEFYTGQGFVLTEPNQPPLDQ